MRLDEATHLLEDVLTDAKKICPNLVIGKFNNGSVGFFDNKNDNIILLAPTTTRIDKDRKTATYSIEELVVLEPGCLQFSDMHSESNIVGCVSLKYNDVYGKFKSTIKDEIIELIKKRW